MRRLLLLTFVQSFATILLERGVYFYTEEVLGFGRVANLGLALVFGLLYAAGAMLSHRVTAARGERPTLNAAVAGLALLNLTLALRPSATTLWLGFAGIAFLEGMKWPVIESYVTAGATPARTMAVLGRFQHRVVERDPGGADRGGADHRVGVAGDCCSDWRQRCTGSRWSRSARWRGGRRTWRRTTPSGCPPRASPATGR